MYPRYADGFGPLHWLMFVFFLLVVASLAWLLVSLALGRFARPQAGGSATTVSPTAIETLDMRYARGEISRDDYLQGRVDLGSPASSG
jgi:putative membrane protein